MVLYIDTTDFNKATFAITDGEKAWKKVYQIDPHKSHETLAKLDEFLKSAHMKSSPRGAENRITRIIVNKGPGSYTGVRVGVTHALALGLAWGIPVKVLAQNEFGVR
jgi:tRNA A37 threonylcarbamoyladenosine modification protein TsaB